MKHLRPAILLTVFFVVLMGIGFPVAVWAVGRVTFPNQASGSLVKDAHGNVVGSSLLGQSFTKPEYFHPRPSAAGSGYDAANSSGTNLGPISDKLVNGIKDDPATKDVDETYLGFKDLAKAYREENGLAPDAVIPAAIANTKPLKSCMFPRKAWRAKSGRESGSGMRFARIGQTPRPAGRV